METGNKRKNLIQNIKLPDNKLVSQLMAWVITRELNLGMSQSSNNESSSSRAPQGNTPAGSSHGSSDSSGGAVFSGITLSPTILSITSSDSFTNRNFGHGSKHFTSEKALENKNNKSQNVKHITNQKGTNIDLNTSSFVLGKIFNLKFHHRHILFNKTYDLPKVGMSNNIGYGGVLYKEKSLNGYVKNNNITSNEYEDNILINAIKRCENFGSYNILTNNCQHWVNKVFSTYNKLKAQRIQRAQGKAQKWKRKKSHPGGYVIRR